MRLGRLVAVIALLIAAPALADTLPRVGSVDVQAVLTKSATGVAARTMLEQEKNGYQAELETLRRQIEKPETGDVFERKRRDMIRLADDRQKALARHEEAVIRQMLEELVKTIRQLGLEQNYDRIVENRTNKAIYERPGVTAADVTQAIDITDEVGRRLDARQFVPR